MDLLAERRWPELSNHKTGAEGRYEYVRGERPGRGRHPLRAELSMALRAERRWRELSNHKTGAEGRYEYAQANGPSSTSNLRHDQGIVRSENRKSQRGQSYAKARVARVARDQRRGKLARDQRRGKLARDQRRGKLARDQRRGKLARADCTSLHSECPATIAATLVAQWGDTRDDKARLRSEHLSGPGLDLRPRRNYGSKAS